MASPPSPLSSNPPPAAAAGHTKSVAVVGGGVSGLAAAYKLKKNGLKVTIFEAEDRVGGKLRTASEDGLLWDEGANTMTESEKEAGRLIDDLNLREKQQFPISQNKRYIVRNGIAQLLPTSPFGLIMSNILSSQSKLKIMLEPLMRKHFISHHNSKVSEEKMEESVGQFFQRHFGAEVVDYLIDPFVAGTSAGDPESLSMRHLFPELWNLEKEYGSVIVGAVQSKLSSKSKNSGARESTSRKKNLSFSFHGGMQTLTDRLCDEVGGKNLKLSSKVLSLSSIASGSSRHDSWSIAYATKDASSKEFNNQSFDAVIMTAPLQDVREMKITKRGESFLLNFLPEVNYLPVSVMITSFKKNKVKRPLEGFGVLVPSKEQKYGFKTLGTLFSSMMFPDRAPSDQYLYTTFVGGSRNRELAGASCDELKQIVTADLRRLLGVEDQPTYVKHVFWRNAFPLYGRDYTTVLEAVDKMEKDLPGFFYAGNHRDGLSVGKSIASGCKAADLVINYLNSCIQQDM